MEVTDWCGEDHHVDLSVENFFVDGAARGVMVCGRDDPDFDEGCEGGRVQTG